MKMHLLRMHVHNSVEKKAEEESTQSAWFHIYSRAYIALHMIMMIENSRFEEEEGNEHTNE